jgi:hypothetical protein
LAPDQSEVQAWVFFYLLTQGLFSFWVSSDNCKTDTLAHLHPGEQIYAIFGPSFDLPEKYIM